MKTFLSSLFAFLAFSLSASASVWAICHPSHDGVPIVYGGGGGGGGNENHPHGPGGQDLGGGGGGNTNVPGPDFVGPRLPEQEMVQPGGDVQPSVDPGFDGGYVSGGGESMKMDHAENAFNNAANPNSGDQTIASQIAADNARNEQERWKIMQDTQTKVLEIQQDVTVNKAQTQDKSAKAWDDYVNN